MDLWNKWRGRASEAVRHAAELAKTLASDPPAAPIATESSPEHRAGKPASSSTVRERPREAGPPPNPSARSSFGSPAGTARGRSEPAPITIPEFAPGARITDTYEIRERIARGPRYDVYLAHHLRWTADVVIKVPRSPQPVTAEPLRALADLAPRWAALGLHPNVACCHYAHDLEGVPLFVIEHVPGTTLAAWAESRRRSDLPGAIDLALQLCHGIAHAHRKGLVHGALGMHNLLLTPGGTVKVTDFGIAALAEDLLGSAPPPPAPPTPGGWSGRECRAPELWAQGRRADERSDLFSLGICLYEIFAAAPPYDSTRGAPRQPLDPYSNLSDSPLPDRLALLLKQCVDWVRERRPASAEEVGRELASIRAELYQQAGPFAAPPPLREADSLNNQAAAAYLLRQDEDADRLWESCLAAQPDHLEATYNLATSRWRRGLISDLVMIRKLANERPRFEGRCSFEHLLALIHLERGDAPSAVSVLDAAPEAELGREEIQSTLALARAQAREPAANRQELEAHEHYVSAVCLSPDATQVLSASDDGSVRLWSAESGRMLRGLDGHAGAATSAWLSADGALALTGGDDRTLSVWDVASGRSLKKLRTTGKVFSCSLSGNGRRAISASATSENFLGIDGTVLQVWDVEGEEGRPLCILRGHSDAAKAAAMNADGSRIATGGDDHTVRLWEGRMGDCLRVFRGHEHYVCSIFISSDGDWVLSGSWDQTLRLWNVTTNRCVRVFRGHDGMVTSVALSTDRRIAVSGSWDKTVRVWEVETGRCLRTFEGHSSMVTSVALSACGKVIASGSWDRTIRIWPAPSSGRAFCPVLLSPYEAPGSAKHKPRGDREPLRPRPAPAQVSPAPITWVLPTAGSPGPPPVAIESAASESAATGPGPEPVPLSSSAYGGAPQLPPSIAAPSNPSAHRAATAPPIAAAPSADLGQARRIRLLSPTPRNGNANRSLPRGSRTRSTLRAVRPAAQIVSPQRVQAVCIKGEAEWFVTAGRDDRLRVWDTAMGRSVRTLKGHTDRVLAVRLDRKESLALSASADRTLRLWDVLTGECLRKFEGHQSVVSALDLDEEKSAVSGSYDHTVRLWDVESGRCLRVFRGHTRQVTAVCSSPDGRYVLSGSYEGEVRLWDARTAECIEACEAHLGSVTALRFDGGSTRAASGGMDSLVQLWNLESGTAQELSGHRAPILSLVFTEDDRWLLSASRDGTARLWNVVTGSCERIIETGSEELTAVALSADSAWILAAGSDNRLCLRELEWEPAAVA